LELQAVRGTRDLLPGQTEKWQAVERIAHEVFAAYGYAEIRTPLFEHTELFVRGVGEGSEIVNKQMYTFQDRKGRSITLRPEGTASVVRAYLEHHLGQGEAGTCKLYYLGPMFRYERPQAGRYRQFFQIGAEAIGYAQPSVDAETIAMLVTLLGRVGLPGLSVDLNSVGCPDCRPAYNALLLAYLKANESRLSEDSKARLGLNTLRVLDSKDAGDIEVCAKAPKIWDYLCSACSSHFASVQRFLIDLKVPFKLNPRLVRGLDYYTRTAFEVFSGNLGAQNAVAGGGRYDGMVAQFSGLSRPAVGFGIGLDRLLLLLETLQIPLALPPKAQVALAALGPAAHREAMRLAQELRLAGVRASLDPVPGKNLKNQLKAAVESGASYAVILGDQELASGKAGVKDLQAKSQEDLPLAGLANTLTERLKR
jgi:histidyl-tRNA synthetase